MSCLSRIRPFQHGGMLAEVAPWLVAATVIASAAVGTIVFDRSPARDPTADSVLTATGRAGQTTFGDERAVSPGRFPDLRLTLSAIQQKETQLVALIAIGKEAPKPYRAGQPLTADIAVHSVSTDRVALRYRSLYKTLALTPAEGAPTVTQKSKETEQPPTLTWQERNPHISPSLLHATNPRAAEEFLRYVEVLPHDGGGFFINGVEPGSIYERLGLQSGDIIHGLESMTATDSGGRPDTAEVRMEVFRDGQSVILTYRPEQ